MEFNFNRFYGSVTIFLRLYINIGNCRSTYEASYFHCNPRHYHVRTTCRALCNPCVFQHRVPAHVTSDRGPEFVSHFFRCLGKALNMKLHFTSGYHPEGEGQTERTNQTLEQYLRIYYNYKQDNWYELFALAEFTYDNTPSATI